MTIDVTEWQEKLERAFALHMYYEYPQIDACTRGELAYELSLVATPLVQ